LSTNTCDVRRRVATSAIRAATQYPGIVECHRGRRYFSIGKSPPPRRRPTPRYDRRSPVESRILTAAVTKGPEWRTSSAASSICFPVWYGLRSLTGTSTFSITMVRIHRPQRCEACGRDWQTAIHPEDLPELLERWRSILASCEPGEMEARLQRFDGE
jgi:hypothetical protein